ncbi:M24 family metallopeptidase [Brucellaceae bacterium C25G]
MSFVNEKRIEALRQQMLATGTDLVVLGPSTHMFYLSGVDPHGDERAVLLLISQKHAGFLMPVLNADSARNKTSLPFVTWADAEGPLAAFKNLVKTCDLPQNPVVALDETMRADFALLVLDNVAHSARKFTNDTVGFLRAHKDEQEFELLKASALLNDAAMKAGYDALKAGISELEVASIIRAYFKANDAQPIFVSVCFGENGAYPHHHTGETKLQNGDAVMIDIGARLNGYPSDMTRSGFFGEPTEKFAHVFNIVNEAVAKALVVAKPGVKASEVDRAARDHITQAGFGEYFLHRTGHGLGLDVHEAPYITATSDVVLEEGMVFSIEPGIYLAKEFGVRQEEIVFMRSDGAEILSDMPRDMIVKAV